MRCLIVGKILWKKMNLSFFLLLEKYCEKRWTCHSLSPFCLDGRVFPVNRGRPLFSSIVPLVSALSFYVKSLLRKNRFFCFWAVILKMLKQNQLFKHHRKNTFNKNLTFVFFLQHFCKNEFHALFTFSKCHIKLCKQIQYKKRHCYWKFKTH